MESLQPNSGKGDSWMNGRKGSLYTLKEIFKSGPVDGTREIFFNAEIQKYYKLFNHPLFRRRQPGQEFCKPIKLTEEQNASIAGEMRAAMQRYIMQGAMLWLKEVAPPKVPALGAGGKIARLNEVLLEKEGAGMFRMNDTMIKGLDKRLNLAATISFFESRMGITPKGGLLRKLIPPPTQLPMTEEQARIEKLQKASIANEPAEDVVPGAAKPQNLENWWKGDKSK
jgi:hypothetical protein